MMITKFTESASSLLILLFPVRSIIIISMFKAFVPIEIAPLYPF
jgi:hypothetical protein